MRTLVRLGLCGLACIVLAPVACMWLLYREGQWRRCSKWHGHYEQPVEGRETITHNDPRWGA